MILLHLINNTILFSMFYWYNTKLFSLKTEQKLNKIMVISLLICFKSSLNLLNTPKLNILVTIGVYLAISIIIFNGTLLKKIIFIGYFLISSFVSEMTTFIFLNSIGVYIPIFKNSLFNLILGFIISSIVLFFSVFYVTKISDIRELSDNKTITPLILLPLLTIIILIIITNRNYLNQVPLFCVVVMIVCFVYNIVMCFSFKDLILSKNIQIENEKLVNKELHYQLLEEKFENSKKFVHDFKKHINILSELDSMNEHEKVRSYLNELSNEIKKEESFVMTGNQLVDLILHSKQKEIEQNKIEIKCEVKIKTVEPVNYLDFNIILSNILDNAIESCVLAQGHFIKIKLDQKDNLIILKVVNPCLKINDKLKTIKENAEYHGYGIKNIKKVTEKYNGMCNFEFDNINDIFTSTVILNTIQ